MGLVLAGPTLSTGAAVAAAPTCETTVIGVLPSGQLVNRDVTNLGLQAEHVSTTALPSSVTSMVFLGSEKVTGGYLSHVNTFGAGTRPRNSDVHTQTTTPTQPETVTVASVYSRGLAARLLAGSARYYVYGVDGHGRLKRWTRESDSSGHLWFDSPKLVARHMGGLKTLSYSWSYKIGGGWKDVLYGTTRGGALKQFKIGWSRPGNAKITTIKKTGFSAYTGLPLSFCNSNSNYLSIVAIDRVHNRARWYTLTRDLAAARREPGAPRPRCPHRRLAAARDLLTRPSCA